MSFTLLRRRISSLLRSCMHELITLGSTHLRPRTRSDCALFLNSIRISFMTSHSIRSYEEKEEKEEEEEEGEKEEDRGEWLLLLLEEAWRRRIFMSHTFLR